MEIYQLRAFVTAARHGNFTRAAKELHLSQPTVSGQIKALEENLSVVLFERKASGVALTKCGADLLPRAEKILTDILRFVAHAKGQGQQVLRKIRLGTVIDAKFLRLGNLLSQMRAEHPNIEIEAHHGLSGWVMNSIRKGELDCGFFVGPIPHADIAGPRLTTMTYRIVAPSAWADQVKTAGWKEIAAMPWVWAPELGSYPQIATEIFHEHGLEPMKVAIADRESTIINLVTSGVGLALLRDSVAHAVAETKELVIWENGSRQANLSFIHLASSHNDPAILATTNTVRTVWAS
jgi:DNA-binding transcriptional LysR family regulator